MSNDEGSQSAPAFAETTARQANDERALNSPFCHSGFLIVSTFGIRALSFFSSTSDSRFAMKISGAGAQQKRQQKEIMKRFILAFIAAYVFIFFWGWLLNGILLKDIYAETPNLWRSQSEMMSLFHWIIIGQALIVFSFLISMPAALPAAASVRVSASAFYWRSQGSACAWAFTQCNRFPAN